MDDRDLFDGFDPSQYEDEGRQRWGHTRAWAEAQERTRRYTREDWAAIQKEGRAIEEGLAALMNRDPADPEVQALVRRRHQRINERFYACPAAMYRGLADMYVDDPCFAAHFDAVQPGLAGFLRDAIHVYCDRLEAQSAE